ncbi:hypothetical protein Bca4012_031600 [Brassica carinata]
MFQSSPSLKMVLTLSSSKSLRRLTSGNLSDYLRLRDSFSIVVEVYKLNEEVLRLEQMVS